MSTIEKTATIVKARFIDLMLSEKVALARLGLAQKDRQVESSRELLDIEAKAIEKKQKAKKTEAEFKDYVNEFFHDALFEYMDERVADEEYLFSEILSIDPNIPKLFDACAAKATGAGRFDELIREMPWLTRDVLNLVNNPPFREANSQKPHVQDVGLAVRYVGVDNIKFALLTYACRSWLPHSTEPYTEFKSKYWQYCLATANCARELAPDFKVNETVAFLYGMIHGIGLSMALRLYLRAFDTVRITQMKKVLKDDRKDIEKILDSLELDHNFVSDGIRKHALKISASLISHLKLKYAVMAPFAQELADEVPFKDAAPMTQVIMQAKSYVQYKMLQKSRLIELDEAKVFLTHAAIKNASISKLNQVNLKKLDLIPKE